MQTNPESTMQPENADVAGAGPVPYKILKEMHAQYKRHSKAILERSSGKLQTDTIWFENNDSFKKFLTELLDPAQAVSGLRVYICEYDEDHIPEDTAPDMRHHYKDKLTIGFVPTKTIDGKEEDHPEAIEKKLIVVDPYNHGKICPPEVCPTP